MKELLFCVHVDVTLKSFTLSRVTLRQRIEQKHVQHDYFSSFNQSDSLFSGAVVVVVVVLAQAP